MANSSTHSALPYPVKGARYTILVPFLDSDGDPLDAVTPDTERSLDGAAFADCSEEVTTISGSNGMGYITLTGDETNCSMLGVAAKVASGPKATLLTTAPRILPILHSGTATAGAAITITLAAGAPAYDISGCIVQTTGGTGGGGGSGSLNNQARLITAYNTSTKVATVEPSWETNPASGTTYKVLITETSMLAFSANATAVNGSAINNLISGRLDVNAQAAVTGLITSTIVADGALTTAKVADGFLTAGKIADNALTAAKIADNAITAAKIAAAALTAAKFATDTGFFLRSFTAQAGGASTIRADAGASSTTNFYAGLWVVTISGTGAGQSRLVTASNGTNKDLTVTPSWAVTPDATTVALLIPAAYVAGSGGDAGTVSALGAQAKADVKAEVLAVMNTDTFTLPGQGTPGGTVSIFTMIRYLYKLLIYGFNKDTANNQLEWLAADNTTVDHKATITSSAGNAGRTKIVSGP